MNGLIKPEKNELAYALRKAKKKKKEERKDYGIEKSNSGFTSVGSRSPVEGGGYGLGHIVGNSAVINTILHFF